MSVDENRCFRFSSYHLDTAERELRRGGEVVPLTPKAFDTLVYLVRNGGHLVTKDDLMTAVWADSFVDEANIPRTIYTLRKTLGDDGNGNRFIQTVPTKGYRFVAPVTQERELEDNAASPADPLPLEIVEKSVESREAGREEPSAVLQFTPESAKVVRNFAIAAGVFGAVLMVVWFIFSPGSVAGGGSDESKSIAVLPVRSLTDQNRDLIYELGIAESLIARLGSAKNLTVRQLDAIRKYEGLENDAVEVGREQRVDYVLASSYQIVDRKFRVTSQLVNVSTGAVEGIFKFDEDGLDPIAVQDAVAVQIGNLVLKRLGRQANGMNQRRYTTNKEAYRLYQRGTALADSRDWNAFPKAVENFEEAVKLDPTYALAYTGLANAHTAMSLPGGEKGANEYFKAREAIEKALELDDTLSEAHTYFAELKWDKEWDFSGAEREFKRAIELNPNSSAAHRMYALMLGLLGRTDEAVSEITTSIDLEPASVLNHRIFSMIMYFGRRYDDAIAEGKLAVEMEPSSRVVPSEIADSYLQKGDWDQAFDWFLQGRIRAGEPAGEIEKWEKVYADSGWRGLREQQIYLWTTAKNKEDYFPATAPRPPMALALLYSQQGDHQRAFDYIEKAFRARQFAAVRVKSDPALDPLRADPRFDELLRRANMK